MKSSKSETPLMRQYNTIKAEHPGTILLFRVGDFYETFSDDAVLISKELGITLTKRNNGGDQTPLAGFPYHALDNYLPKLVKKGHRVAVCDQTEDPAEAKAQKKKIVDREVTEIVTPGVTMSDKLLEHRQNNYAFALHWSGSTAGVAFSDISTGEFALCQVAADELESILSMFNPSEVLVSKKMKDQLPDWLHKYMITHQEEWIFDYEYAYQVLVDQFKTHSLKGFGVEELPIAQIAAGALLHYIKENQRASLGHLRRIFPFENTGYMVLDAATKRNLELTSSLQHSGTEGTLISILDDTKTAMGARELRKWIMRPLKNLDDIQERLDAVEAFFGNHEIRLMVRDEMDQIGDLERLISRISVGRANARDLQQLQLSLERIIPLKMHLQAFTAPLVTRLRDELSALIELQERIKEAIVEDPPAGIRDGGIIKENFSDELQEIRDIARNGKKYIAGIQRKLIEETGISSLKMGYNKVFGYYIEVTKVHQDKVPDTFIRKQTLVNAERYITPELKEIEEKVLSAEERMNTLEFEIFNELRTWTAEFAPKIQQNARAIAALDCLQSLAESAFHFNYVKPEVDSSNEIRIESGRHPVVERTLPLGEPFIPNDIYLDTDKEQLMIITGPNMAGKSIILRQTGLIVLMAQVGSFVPASFARVGLVDKIFTRVGASDNLSAGESTFLVEMNEAANILNNASARSLILLDEVGRGTSTFDGLSIAWSLAEYLHNQPRVAARTLFATHYHELNELESLYERVINYNVQVKEHEGKVIFLRKLVRGGSDHSYGIQVAAMAGLPDIVIERAREILFNLEQHSLDITNKNGAVGRDTNPGDKEGEKSTAVSSAGQKKSATDNLSQRIPKQEKLPQFDLFTPPADPVAEKVRERVKDADLNSMTPIQAMMFLAELKQLIKGK
ncbi:MAG: DNA mismatch repair protein MutS [Balneolales bacterium]|nr:DNA mismatch repair protein MutS [Balneolales bacterium]